MSFSDLLARARDGDQDALAEIYERFAGRVTGAVRRRLKLDLRRKYDSTDLVQSVFAEVLKDIPRIEDRGEEAFRNWLYIKTENKVRGKLRRVLGKEGERVERPLDSKSPIAANESGPATRAAGDDENRKARDLLASLDEDGRTVVALRLEQGLSFEEIAQQLNLASADAARKRYARAVGRMRKSAEG